MTAVVFLGSSLDIEQARTQAPTLELRPPARRGDVYRAVSQGATIVGIVDGELDQALPVWHKELLWALRQGVQLFGAASMGALRAVELEPFGMVGLGRVFEWYQSSLLEDDDEVVVAHATAEGRYRPLSEAMVNVRATLQNATERGLLSGEDTARLLSLAKATHYADRSFGALRAQAVRDSSLGGRLDEFWKRLPDLRIDVKAQDAVFLLHRVEAAATLGREARPEPPEFELARTSAWEGFVAHFARKLVDGVRPVGHLSEMLIAYHRALALALAQKGDSQVDAGAVQAASEAFRRRRGLLSPEATRQWLDEEGLSLAEFSEQMHEEALVSMAGQAAQSLALAHLDRVKWLVGPDTGSGSALAGYARATGLLRPKPTNGKHAGGTDDKGAGSR